MVHKKPCKGRFASWALLLALAALALSGCGRGAPTSAPPPQQPTATPAGVATPTQTAVSQPVTATEVATPTETATAQPATAAEVATPTQTATAQPATATAIATPTQTATPQPATAAGLPKMLDHLHSLGHASFWLDGPPTVYIDPTSAPGDAPRADVILISHEHSDHYAPAALQQLSTAQTVIVTNARVAAQLEQVSGVAGEVRVVQPGDKTTVGDVEIEAVPAYNIGKTYHPREAGGLGFILTWGGERLYFAGDTDHIPEMAGIACDVALLPIGGTYTMDVQEAVQAAADIDARVFVPMHARSANPEQFRDLCDCTVVIMEE